MSASQIHRYLCRCVNCHVTQTIRSDELPDATCGACGDQVVVDRKYHPEIEAAIDFAKPVLDYHPFDPTKLNGTNGHKTNGVNGNGHHLEVVTQIAAVAVAVAISCETCHDMRHFVVATKTGSRELPCPDCR